MPALTPEEKQRIYEEEKARLEAQDKIKKEANPKRGQQLTIGCLVVFGLFALLIGISSMNKSGKTPEEQSQAKRNYFNSGEIGKLVNVGGTRVMVGVTEDALKEINNALYAGDPHGYLELLTSGQAFGVDNGTKILVIDEGYGKRRVRVLDGPMTGKSGWVNKEWIK